MRKSRGAPHRQAVAALDCVAYLALVFLAGPSATGTAATTATSQAVTPSADTLSQTSPADIPTPERPVSERSIAELFRQMNGKELYGGLSACFAILGAVFFAGKHWGQSQTKTAEPLADSEMLAMASYDSPAQATIRKRPAVEAFVAYLTAAEEGRFKVAYDLLAEQSRVSPHETPDALGANYRMTVDHTLRHFIPVELTPDREVYDVDFEYRDRLPHLPALRRMRQTPLGVALTAKQRGPLTKEMLEALNSNFDTEGRSHEELVDAVENHLRNEVTLRDLVLHDAILEKLGQKLGLRPIPAEEVAGVGAGDPPPTLFRRYVRVTMLKRDGGWKLKAYDSILMTKR